MRTSRLVAFAALGGGLLGGALGAVASTLWGHPPGPGGFALVGVPAAILSAIAAALAVERELAAPLRTLLRFGDAGPASRPRLGRSASREVEAVDAALTRWAAGVDRRVEQADADHVRLFQVLDTLPVGILRLDGRGRISLANPAARAILDLVQDPVGRSPVEVVRSGELQSAVDAALARPAERTVECTLQGPPRRLVTVHLSPVADGLVAVIQDVTRIRRLEDARRDMVANIGHELRTPLSAILGYLETLEHSADLPESERARFLAIIARNSRRLERLVRDLSRLSRLESAGFALQREEIGLGSALAVAFETITPTAAEKAISLSEEVPRDLPPLWADRDGLETVLLNLLDNAVRVTPPGGDIRVGARADGSGIRVWVDDTGPGVPREFRERVFERFYRLDFGRSAQEGGSGLGLAIVKHTVLQHGGEIGIEESPGGGARFWFQLPAAVSPESVPTP